MSILNITNITDDPKGLIYENYFNAFIEYEKDKNIKIDHTEKYDFIANQIEQLAEFMENSLGKDLLNIIDNYLVNLDYYLEVKNWYEKNKKL